jgi:hypothetical protein
MKVEANKATATAFYGLMFNRCEPAEAVRLNVGGMCSSCRQDLREFESNGLPPTPHHAPSAIRCWARERSPCASRGLD